MSRRWSALRTSAGACGPVIDVAHRVYRTLRAPLFPERQIPPDEIDGFLRSTGAEAAHFADPIWLDTTLPFVYEPWDLIHCHHPEFFSEAEVQDRDRRYREGCRRARLVVAATQWVKADLVRRMGLPPERIAVIPRAISRIHRGGGALTAGEEAQLRELPSGFAFFPAMTFPHKNHAGLFEALARIRRQRGLRLNLVCTGRFYSKPAGIDADLRRLELRDQVRMLGPVSEAMLQALFRSARFLVFPSLFEGLGLPLLEAFESGLPVVASDATCIPEVVGDAALLFDARNPDAIADALVRAAQEPDLLEDLRRRGRTRLQAFSWDEAARKFQACYRFAAGRRLDAAQLGLLETMTGAKA